MLFCCLRVQYAVVVFIAMLGNIVFKPSSEDKIIHFLWPFLQQLSVLYLGASQTWVILIATLGHKEVLLPHFIANLDFGISLDFEYLT